MNIGDKIMGDKNLQTSIAHLFLALISGHDLSKWHAGSFSHPGLHGNYFVNGILGFLHYQRGVFNTDVSQAFLFSSKATKYLALPCLMADLYKSNDLLSILHLASGVIPYALLLTGTEDEKLGDLVVASNVLSLCLFSYDHNRPWGWYTAAAAAFIHFVIPKMQHKQLLYPLGLSLVEYCAYRVFSIHF